MKSLMRIYVKYIVTVVLLILSFILLQVGILGVVALKMYGYGSEYGKYAIRQVYDVLPQTQEALDSEPVEAAAYLEDMNAAFAMLLDHGGQPVWTFQLPENLNHVYTIQEVASFSRWYLDDYPVSVWGGDKGLLVVGT